MSRSSRYVGGFIGEYRPIFGASGVTFYHVAVAGGMIACFG